MEVFLNSVLRGLINYSTIIFILLIFGILLYFRKFLAGIREWQRSVFGLERSFAQRKLFSASTGIVLLVLLLVGEFLLVTLLKPQMPGTSVDVLPALNTPGSPTMTLSAETESLVETPTIDEVTLESACIEGQLEITSPAEGEAISGTVEVIGSVNIENFGSYKYEYSSVGTINWVTVAAGNELKLDESLGFWYTSALTPGTYLLRLVPQNNAGVDLTPCIVPVEVVAEE